MNKKKTTNTDLVMKSSFVEHVYDLTGSKYAEKYEDSDFDIKSKHFLTQMT